MKSVRVFLILVFMVFCLPLKSQEVLVKLLNHHTPIECQDLTIEGDWISFKNLRDGLHYTYPKSDLDRINFVEGRASEVFLISKGFITIACRLDSIGEREVYYSTEDGVQHREDKANLAAVLFNDNKVSDIPPGILGLIEYKNAPDFQYSPTLSNNKGELLAISRIISLKGDLLKYTTIKGEMVEISTADISYLTQKQAEKPSRRKKYFSCLLSANGELERADNIRAVNPDNIEVTMQLQNIGFRTKRNKADLVAIVFLGARNMHKPFLNNLNKAKRAGNVIRKQINAKVDWNVDFLSMPRFNYPFGLSFDHSAVFFLNNKIGLGYRFNQTFLSKNMLSFAGVSFYNHIQTINNKTAFYYAVSLGMNSLVEFDANANSIEKNNEFGAFITLGVDYRFFKGLGIGPQMNFHLGRHDTRIMARKLSPQIGLKYYF